MDIQNTLEQAKQRGLSAIDSIRKAVTTPQPTTMDRISQGVQVLKAYDQVKKVLTPKPTNVLQKAYETYQTIQPIAGVVQGITKGFGVPKTSLPALLQAPLTSNAVKFTSEYLERVAKPIADTIQVAKELNPGTLGITSANRGAALATKQIELGRTLTPEEFISIAKPQISLDQIFAPFEVLNQAIVQPAYDTLKVDLYNKRKQLGYSVADITETPGQLRRAAITGTPTPTGRSEITLNEVFNVDEKTNPTLYQVNRFIDFTPELIAPGPGELAAFGASIKGVKGASRVDDAIDAFKAEGKPLTKAAEDFIKDTFKSADDVKNYLKEQIGGIKQIDQAERNVISVTQKFADEIVRKEKAARELARGEVPGIKGKLSKIWEDYKVNFETQQEAIYKAIKLAEKQYGKLNPSQNPIYYLDILFRSGRQTEEYITKNGLVDILTQAKQKGSTDEFGSLLLNRRLLTVADETGIDLPNRAEKERFVAFASQKYADLLARYDNYMQGLLKFIYDNNLIDEAEYNRLKELKDYAPFQKVFDEADTPELPKLSTTTFGSVNDPRLVQKLKDIANTIHENPLESTLYYTYRAVDKANQNKFASLFGDLIKQGKIDGAEMIRVAEDVIRRTALINDVEELKKVRDAVRRFIKKKNIQKGVLEKEFNSLARKGINLSLRKTTVETMDPVVKDRLVQRVKSLTKDRNKLQNEIEKLNIKGLDLQVVRDFEGFTKAVPAPELQRILDKNLVKKEEFLTKLLAKSDNLIKEKFNKYISKEYGLNLKELTDEARLNFFRNSTPDELERFVFEVLDITPKRAASFFNKLRTSKGKIAETVKEIENLRNQSFVNNIIDTLYRDEQQILKQLAGKQSELKPILKEIADIKSNIYYNELFNSLVKKSPDELEIIQKQLGKSEKNIKNIVDIIVEGQRKLDETSGAIARREQEIKTLMDKGKDGKAVISWYNNGVRELATVSKELGEAFKLSNETGTMEAVLNIAGKLTNLWKASVVGLNPVSQIRQFVKDQGAILFFTSPRAKLSVLNPLNFMEAAYGVTASSTRLGEFLSKAPIIGKRMEQAHLKARREYKNFLKLGGGQTSYDAVSGRETVKSFVEAGGKPKAFSRENIEKYIAKSEEATRFQLYLIQKKQYLRKGYSDLDASLKAVYDSNNLLPNYFQKGKFGRVLEVASPFANAKLKSARALRTYIAEKPAEATFSILTTVAAPVAAITYWNLSDENRRNAYSDIPEWEKELGLIILPPFPVKNENGKYEYIRIPQEETVAGLAQGYRRATEIAMSEDPDKVQQVWGALLDTTHDLALALFGQEIGLASTPEKAVENLRQGSAAAINPYLRSPLELLTGYDLFKGQTIEDLGDLKEYSYRRFSKSSTPLAVDLSKFLFDNGIKNVSPKEIDFFLAANFPGLPQYALGGLNDLLNKSKANPSDFEPKTMLNDIVKIFKREGGGEQNRKLFLEKEQQTFEKTKENAGIKELIKDIYTDTNAEDARTKLREITPNLTSQQFRALENSVQLELAEESLTPDQKVILNFSKDDLETLKETNPERTEDIDKVLEVKDLISKQKNISGSSIGLKSTGGGPSLSIKASKVKLPKVSKPKKVRMPKVSAPKKLTVKKPKATKAKRIKGVKVPRVKPLKRIKRF